MPQSTAARCVAGERLTRCELDADPCPLPQLFGPFTPISIQLGRHPRPPCPVDGAVAPHTTATVEPPTSASWHDDLPLLPMILSLPVLNQPYSSVGRNIKQREWIRRLHTRRYLTIDVELRNSIVALPTACARRAALETRLLEAAPPTPPRWAAPRLRQLPKGEADVGH